MDQWKKNLSSDVSMCVRHLRVKVISGQKIIVGHNLASLLCFCEHLGEILMWAYLTLLMNSFLKYIWKTTYTAASQIIL